MLPPSGDVTLAFAELEELDAALAAGGENLARLEALLVEAVTGAGGYRVKSSPGHFMAAFQDASAGIGFAGRSQQAIAAAAWEGGRVPRLRIGLHTGPAIREDGPDGSCDYFGPTVNRAARIAAAAHGGQVLVSAATRAGCAGAGDARFLALGEHRLRGLERPESIYQLSPAGLPATFPPLLTHAVQKGNLPAQASSFVGRRGELARLQDLLAGPGPGLVTLTGLAGVGKTRLAVRVASELQESLEGGCWFVDVAEVRDPAGLAEAVLRVLGIPAGTQPGDQVAELCMSRPPTLFLLDTCDHVARSPATLPRWLTAEGMTRFLLTSRVATGHPLERELRLEPFDSPGARDSDAVRLFVDRACETKPDFEVTPANEEDVREICLELEGVPLAIELAAARIRILQPGAMRKKLGQKFQLLRSVRQDAAPRQQTLLGAVEWSLELLTPVERRVFERLSVFHGGFLAPIAREVVGPEATPEVIESLRQKSLLSVREHPWGRRYLHYRVVHECAERLWRQASKPEERRALEERHAAAALAYLAKLKSAAGPGADEEVAERLELAAENLRAIVGRSLGWLEEAGTRDRAAAGKALETAAHAAIAIHTALSTRTSGDSSRRSIREVARAWFAHPAAAELLPARVSLDLLEREAREARNDNDAAQAQTASDAAVKVAGTADDPLLLARAYVARSTSRTFLGDPNGALADAAAAESLASRTADAAVLCLALGSRALALKRQGKFDEAFDAATQAFARARETGMPSHLSQSASILGALCEILERPGEALAWQQRADDYEAASTRKIGRPAALAHRAAVLGRLGRWDEALKDLQSAEAQAHEYGRRRLLGGILATRASVLRRARRFPEALAEASRAIEAIRPTGDLVHLAGITFEKGWILQSLGRGREAGPLLAAARETFARVPHAAGVFQCRVAEGRLFHESGDLPAARRALPDVLEPVPGVPEFLRFEGLAALAELESREGNRAAAADAARRALAICAGLGPQQSTLLKEMEPAASRMRTILGA